jgi:DNA-binding CsgD family transcriptional regulator
MKKFLSDEVLIANKINEIKNYEQDIPAVIIIIRVSDSSVVYMSELGRKKLGVTQEELIAMGPDYHQRFFNSEESNEYAPRLVELLQHNNDDELISLLQQVRADHDQPYSWHITGLKILLKNADNVPLLIIATAIPLDAMHELANKAQRVLDENNYLKKNYHLFESLTKRETELLKLFAKGCSNECVATQLYISIETVATHRKNIKRKLNCKSNYDCTYFAQAFDLI